MNTDLTENDIVVRQINCSKIVDRLLMDTLKNKSKPQEKFCFEQDFYSQHNYWFKAAIPLKLVALFYIVLLIPLSSIIGFLSILSPLNQLNTVLQIKKKQTTINKCQMYLQILSQKIDGDNYFDHHFYMLSVYSKLQSLITSMVFDIILGVFLLLIVNAYTTEILAILHYFGQFLHIEVLRRQV